MDPGSCSSSHISPFTGIAQADSSPHGKPATPDDATEVDMLSTSTQTPALVPATDTGSSCARERVPAAPSSVGPQAAGMMYDPHRYSSLTDDGSFDPGYLSHAHALPDALMV